MIYKQKKPKKPKKEIGNNQLGRILTFNEAHGYNAHDNDFFRHMENAPPDENMMRQTLSELELESQEPRRCNLF